MTGVYTVHYCIAYIYEALENEKHTTRNILGILYNIYIYIIDFYMYC